MTIKFDGHAITASEEMLVRLAMWAYEAAENMDTDGHPISADYAARFGAKVIHELSDVGYFDETV